MHPSHVLTMGLAAAAHIMDKAHLTSKSATSTTTNTATVTSTSPVTKTTAPAHLVSNSTVWLTTTLSATTQFVAATASNTTVAPSTSWVTATASATTTFVDWTIYPAVPVTLTTSPTAPLVTFPASTSGITIVLKGLTISGVVTTTSYVAPRPTSFPDNASKKMYNYFANCHDQQKCKYSEECDPGDVWPQGWAAAHFDNCYQWCREGHNAACDTLEKDNLFGVDYPADFQGYPTTSYSGEVAKWPPPTAYPRA